jgi:hypothetical protein
MLCPPAPASVSDGRAIAAAPTPSNHLRDRRRKQNAPGFGGEDDRADVSRGARTVFAAAGSTDSRYLWQNSEKISQSALDARIVFGENAPRAIAVQSDSATTAPTFALSRDSP